MRNAMKKPQLASLNCPACGASISNDPGANSVKCQYCGNTLVFDEEDGPGDAITDEEVDGLFSEDQKPARGPKAPPPPQQVIVVPNALDPKVQRQVQQAVSRAQQASKVAAVLPAIIIFTTLLIGGSIAFFTSRGVNEHQKRIQDEVKQRQEEAERERKKGELERERQKEQRERDQWTSFVEGNRNSLPVGFDALLAESLPEGWPTLTRGASSTTITITWYAAYVSTYEQRVFAALKTALRKYDQKIKVNVIPLPAQRGRHTQTMEAMLEILEQKGEGAFEELHERFAQEGQNAFVRGNYIPLCEIMDCDVKKFQKAMKSRVHAAKVASLAAVSKKLNLDRHMVFRIQDSLFYDQMSIVGRFDDVIEGYLRFGELK
jgi:hypothetical protein